ncbi:MAG TPA: YkgJ family cysteine cluster protein [Candidatus Polarisedimenticolia bacterium]|nr:YkgJ family cysteine cluster protein [Candidatus Polarisedimenticolia bacterium]
MLRPTSSLTFRQRLTLARGKVRRLVLAHFRPGYVRESLARRVGSCHRTGACCHLMFTCPLLDQKAEPVRCSIHEIKPKVCRLFPIDERDLRDRDIISPDTPCGFTFIPRAEFLARGASAVAQAEEHVHPETIDLPRT